MLQVIDIDTKKSPLMMEVSINPSLDGPYLVSGSKKLLWIEEKFPGNFIRAAVRDGLVSSALYGEIVLECVQQAEKRMWGSINTTTLKGFKKSTEYLNFFGFEQLEVHSSKELFEDVCKFNVEIKSNYKVHLSPWVPQGFALILPVDKSYLGSLYRFSNDSYAAFVHNPSRGVVFLCP